MARTLGVVMIARDEAARIGRAVSSVRGAVDEVLVVDTGSADATVEVARAAGARVESFGWVDDFAAARNASLALSSADVRLVLDADEWLAPGQEAALAALRELPAGTAGLVIQRNEVVVGGVSTFSDDPVVRVLPRGARYEGRIHEQPAQYARVVQTGIVLEHDGYLPESNAAKRGRNERLLRMDIAAGVAGPYTWYQLGKDLEVQQRWAEAADAYARADGTGSASAGAGGADSAGAGGAHTAGTAPWRHELVTRRLYVTGRAGRFDQAIAQFGAAEAEFPQSPDLYFVMADVLLDHALAHPELAAEILPHVGACLERCLQIGERPDFHGSVKGRGSVLAEANLAVWREATAALTALSRA